jgi:RNA polymerase sigma-70 factor, ECF subfamily
MIEHPTEVIRPVRQTADRPDAARAELFARLVDRPALDKAYRYATLVLGSRSDAEDATHDAALSAWRRFGDLRDPARFDAWFGKILVNACRDQLRTRGRAPLSLDAGPAGPTDYAYAPSSRVTADQADAVADHEALGVALRTLSPDQREVVVLRYYFDLTVDQIAARTGARQGTVKSRLHHALRYLRSAIEPTPEGSADR